MKHISFTMLLGLLFILSSTALSQDACPNPKPLKNICLAMESRTKTSDQSMFLYKRKILDASCVLPTDSEKMEKEKIREMWAAIGEDLSCSSPSFDVINGNLVKFAVSLTFDAFIADVANWRVNLNKVDQHDDLTVLDYVNLQIQRNKGNAREVNLRAYSSMLTAGGALRRVELESKNLIGSKSDRLKEEFEKLRIKSESGDQAAAWSVGWAYLRGEGVDKDTRKGLQIVESVAENSLSLKKSESSRKVGDIYAEGIVTPQNISRAIFWYERAVASSDSYREGVEAGEPMYRLAKLYLDGKLVKQDVPKAVVLLKRGADTGNGSAQGLLGDLYDQGFGVPKNRKIAECLWWYEKLRLERKGITKDMVETIDKKICQNMSSK